MSGGLARVEMALALLVVLACSDAPPSDSAALPPGSLLHDFRESEGSSRVVLVRVVSGPGALRFEPAEIRLVDDATLRFVMTGRSPDAVVFDADSLSPSARAFLRERSSLRGPLLVTPGQVYDVHFDGAPQGRYPFRSLLHGSRGMRGEVRVERADRPADAAESS